jgi:hypothetical protein
MNDAMPVRYPRVAQRAPNALHAWDGENRVACRTKSDTALITVLNRGPLASPEGPNLAPIGELTLNELVNA